jgi:hypothetical protein
MQVVARLPAIAKTTHPMSNIDSHGWPNPLSFSSVSMKQVHAP